MHISIEVFSHCNEDAALVMEQCQDSVNKYLSGFDASQIVNVIPQVTEAKDVDGVIWTRYTVTVVLKTK